MERFIITPTPLEGLKIIMPKPICDERGYFERYFCAKEFSELGFRGIAQINHSFTKAKGAIRGMHYQTSPFCETKIIRCLSGSIYDVAVDIRKDSPTFLQYFGIELNASNTSYLYIPEGFAHGFQALSDNAEILYLVSEFYTPSADSVINPLDSAINIKWQLEVSDMSLKDRNAPFITSDFSGIGGG